MRPEYKTDHSPPPSAIGQESAELYLHFLTRLSVVRTWKGSEFSAQSSHAVTSVPGIRRWRYTGVCKEGSCFYCMLPLLLLWIVIFLFGNAVLWQLPTLNYVVHKMSVINHSPVSLNVSIDYRLCVLYIVCTLISIMKLYALLLISILWNAL